MRIFSAGWVLQKPDLNFFKRLIHLNKNISLAGVVYPKKIPLDIEGIPVLDFPEARQAIAQGDIVLESSSNQAMQEQFRTFFETQQIKTTSVPDFVNALIMDDEQDQLRLPFEGILSRDIREFQRTSSPNLVDDRFFDFESFDVAQKLDVIFRTSDWGLLCEFDRDETPENVLLETIRELHVRGVLKHLKIIDSPRIFLNAILKLRLYESNASFRIELSDLAIEQLGPRLEFYQRSLGDCIVSSGGDAAQEKAAILLSRSADQLASALQLSGAKSAICFMQRSIIDYSKLKQQLGTAAYRILLRQPDTSPSNLIAVLLSPVLQNPRD